MKHLFTTGKSGNPSGMVKGTKHRVTVVRERLVSASIYSGFEGEIDTLARIAMSASVDARTAREAQDRLTAIFNEIRTKALTRKAKASNK